MLWVSLFMAVLIAGCPKLRIRQDPRIAPDALPSPGADQAHRGIPLEEVEKRPQRLAARRSEARIGGEHELRVATSRLEKIGVDCGVGDTEMRHAGLARAEHFARSPKPQILL